MCSRVAFTAYASSDAGESNASAPSPSIRPGALDDKIYIASCLFISFSIVRSLWKERWACALEGMHMKNRAQDMGVFVGLMMLTWRSTCVVIILILCGDQAPIVCCTCVLERTIFSAPLVTYSSTFLNGSFLFLSDIYILDFILLFQQVIPKQQQASAGHSAMEMWPCRGQRLRSMAASLVSFDISLRIFVLKL